ncbi:MAG: cysteine desulfurase [Streptococcaceae bacterium]|jgi:cysteine desulfurase|nr:cysteine desulfurase [Streptococcaceae bacterium]
MIYFDNSATTAIYPQALDSYIRTSQRIIGNPSSLHYLGSQSYRLLSQARSQVADTLDVSPEEIFFTSGGTEGDNWVMKGTAIEKRQFGKHILLSQIEHPAVYETANQLSSLGFEVEFIPVDARGFVILEDFKRLLRKDTILVSVMAVNNEIGSIQPIREIGEILKDYPTIHFHVDAVQAIGKIPFVDYITDRVDFAVFSGHKFHAPRGVGFIYAKKGRRIAPLLTGGGQEMNKRSSTENVPAIVSMAKALRLYMEKNQEKEAYKSRIRDYLIQALSGYGEIRLFTEANENFAPHILTFGIRGVRGEVLVHALEEKEIITSTTSACSSKKVDSSSTLFSMGVKKEVAQTAIRLSLDVENTMAEAEEFMVVLNHLLKKFEKINR